MPPNTMFFEMPPEHLRRLTSSSRDAVVKCALKENYTSENANFGMFFFKHWREMDTLAFDID